jgi:hypothetical protein
MSGNVVSLNSRGVRALLRDLVIQAIDTALRRGGYAESYRQAAVAMAHEATAGLQGIETEITLSLPSDLSDRQFEDIRAGVANSLQAYHQRLFVPVVKNIATYVLLRISLEEQAKAHGLELVPRSSL